LVLLFLIASAVAQDLTGDHLRISGSGPHAIGGATGNGTQLTIAGTFAPNSAPGNGFGVSLSTNLGANGGQDSALFNIDGTLNQAGSANINDAFGLRINPQFAAAGGGATFVDAGGIHIIGLVAPAGTTNASGLKIANAPSGATNNYALWVAGGATRLDGTLHVAGDVQVDGNIAAKYQDVAEWVPVPGRILPGTVVIIDPKSPNQVIPAFAAYDLRVAGVVSERPGLLLGEAGNDKAKVAHSGRVKVKVDARYGAIQIGDLLVASPTPGHAMRSEPLNVDGVSIHRPGTLLGKALEPLSEGPGEILVLLTLQ
jgi:hypothetical protein